ncbi:MAG: DUF2922 domain-containing protein [Eubacterium sp.]
MSVNISKDLVLTFGGADGKGHNITIPDYKNAITDAEIKIGALAIVTQGIFEPNGYALVEFTGAVRVDTTKTDVVVVP